MSRAANRSDIEKRKRFKHVDKSERILERWSICEAEGGLI